MPNVLPFQSGATLINGALSLDGTISSAGIGFSHEIIGGFIEVPSIEHRNEIPSDSVLHTNGLSCGRRKLGMIVFVKSENKFYQLRPNVKGVEITQEAWNNASEKEKICLLDPMAELFDRTVPVTRKRVGTKDPNDAWMELNIGLKGTGGGGDDLIDNEFEVIETTIGSYAPGSKVLKGEKVEDVIKKMLQKRTAASYTAPTVTASGWPAALMEIGAPVAAFTITPTFNKNDGGDLTGYVYKKDGADATASIAAYTAKASTAFNVDATYGDGPIKKDNMGVEDPAGQIKAGTVSTSFTQSAIYPYFWGVSTTQPTEASVKAAITAKTANKVIAGSDGNVSITFAASSQFLWFATPATSTTKKRWYNTESNQAGIGPGELFNSPLTSKVTSGENYWTDIDYKIYLGSGATSTNGVMQLRNN